MLTFVVAVIAAATVLATNETVNVYQGTQIVNLETDTVSTVEKGTLLWPLPKPSEHASDFFIARKILDEIVAAEIIGLLRDQKFPLDRDSVDQAATYQYWLFAHNRRSRKDDFREKVQALLEPVISSRVLPLVNTLYADQLPPGTALVPCFSFIRRYNPMERVRHPTHFDVHAYATFVVSLNSFGDDYVGGLYVTTTDNHAERAYVDLAAGDGVVHQSDLLHGVKLISGERWSWVVWFRPGTCTSDSTLWHSSQAEDGDPIYQFLLARRHLDPDEGSQANRASATKTGQQWLQAAAAAGFARAENEWGEHLRTSGARADSHLWLKRAADHGDANAIYNLGLWHLDDDDELAAFSHFVTACSAGCNEACFNVAIAHHKGKAGMEKNDEPALQILRGIDTPEAMWYAYEISQDANDLRRAAALGSADAEFELGTELVEENPKSEEALFLLKRAASRGHRGAIHFFRRA